MQQKTEEIIARNCGSKPSIRNRVALLHNGSQTYAALLAALHRARHSILLEYYAFDDDRIGQAISDILIRKARNGVRVSLIYDLLGSWLPAWGMLRRLRRAGVEVLCFRPLRILHLWHDLNIRNHRKIAIIDGEVAFLGGVNIARRYLEGNELGRWRDEHLRLEGEALEDLCRLFKADRRRLLKVEPTFVTPSFRPLSVDFEGRQRVQILWSEEGSTRLVVEQTLLELIASAREEILLASPYYLPPAELQEALCEALKRGVRVSLMVPGRSDLRLLPRAAEELCGQLLKAGANLFCYEGGFLHTKMVVADRRVALLGSPNLDYRSLRINWEVAALISDPGFAAEAAESFWTDSQSCRRLFPAEWEERTQWQKARSRMAWAFRKLL